MNSLKMWKNSNTEGRH